MNDRVEAKDFSDIVKSQNCSCDGHGMCICQGLCVCQQEEMLLGEYRCQKESCNNKKNDTKI